MELRVNQLSSVTRCCLARDKGYFPVSTVTDGGDVLIVYRAGAGHLGKEGRLEAIVSHDGGLTWDAPVTVADSELDDRNRSVGVTSDGTIVVAYHVNGNYAPGVRRYDEAIRSFQTRVTSSTDGGKTWGEPYRLSEGRFYGFSPYGQMLTLQDGGLLLPVYGSPSWTRGSSEPVRSVLLRSDDKGISWQEYAAVGQGLNETAILTISNSRMIAVARVQEDNHLALSTSGDLGRHWEPTTGITRSHEHPACLTLLSGGYVFLTFGWRGEPFGVRGLISNDGGSTWMTSTEIILADDAPNEDCGYPSTVRLRSGRILTAYYSTAEVDAWSCEGATLNLISYDESELLERVTL